jgi:hypothetical protein
MNAGPILDNARAHTQLVTFGDNGIEHGAYVLMPDHLHAFVVIDASRIDLSDWIKSLKNTLSKTLRIDGVPSPHWQKAFSITSCVPGTRIRRNGSTFVTIRCAPDL